MVGLEQKKIVWFLFLHYTCASSLQFSPPSKENEKKIDKYLKNEEEKMANLLKNYDKRFIPAAPGLPLVVKLGLVVSDVLKLENMEIEMILNIKQEWYDYRLKNNYTKRLKVREHLLDKIWLPDLRIIDLKEVKRFDGFGAINMNIHPDGRVYYSQTALVKIDCPMILYHFPMDRQTCAIKFGSYAYPASLLSFMFGSNNTKVRQVHLPQYDFVEYRHVNSEKLASKIHGAKADLVFQRRVGYYILQIYVPSTFLVILSWLSFLMGPLDIADRLALDITMILSIVFLLGGINESIPHVSYAKASDWFVIVSFGFIFLALLETMLVYRIKKAELRKKKKGHSFEKTSCFRLLPSENTKMVEENCYEHNSECDDSLPTVNGQTTVRRGNKKTCSMATFIDNFCFVAFPVTYIGFTTFYWSYYKSY